MQNMQAHRLAAPFSAPSFIRFTPPFSCFKYVESLFAGWPSVHRCFSLARSFGAKTLIEEHLSPAGIISQENEELAALGLTQSTHDLRRLSFWDRHVTVRNATSLTDKNLIGYAILKRDIGEWQGFGIDQWHVFEAVFKKYAHLHNCLPDAGAYSVRIGDKTFTARGVLYCQQNGLNKACAHVAIRSLLSRLVPEHDVSYSSMNKIARECFTARYRPSGGLTVQQIRSILRHYEIEFRDIAYNENCEVTPDIRKDQPYQKYLYSGIESGCGGLLGFSMDGPKATQERHIIPFYGHTFNKDTWAPDADASYFNIGANVGYIPSDSWTSSFLGHDDNFGPCFCIPRLYVKAENVQYVVEVLQSGAQYNGIIAEAIALRLLYSLYPKLETSNAWQKRLAQHVHPDNQKVVLRACCVQKEKYLTHLRCVRDWEGKSEEPGVLSALEAALPSMLWIVEFSIPHLFPANERKIGEIVLDARCPPEGFLPFIIARLPGNYLTLTDRKSRSYGRGPSRLQSHVEVMRQPD